MSTIALSLYKAFPSPNQSTPSTPEQAPTATSIDEQFPTLRGTVIEDSTLSYLITAIPSPTAHQKTNSHPSILPPEPDPKSASPRHEHRRISTTLITTAPNPSPTIFKNKGKPFILAIGTHTIDADKAQAFEATFEAVKHNLEHFPLLRGGLLGGWREVEAEEDSKAQAQAQHVQVQGGKQHEWVLLSMWDDVRDHGSFAQSPAFEEYSKIRPFVARFEVVHVRIDE